MSSTRTEKQAKSTLEQIILDCPHLIPRFNDDDSLPFTDGHIDIYSDESHTKVAHLGEVPVQIKGRTRKARSDKISFNELTVADFNGYLNKRGVIFFLVLIDPETDNRTTYFSVLNPWKIKYLLRMTSLPKDPVAFQLEPLPEEQSAIEAIVKYAHQLQEENPEVTLTDKSWEGATEWTLFTPGPLPLDKPVVLRPGEKDYSVRLTSPDGYQAFAQATLELVPEPYMPRRSNITVSSGDIVYENPIWFRQDDAHIAVHLSDSLRLSLGVVDKGVQGGSLQWELDRKLETRLRDLTFVLKWLEEGGIAINGRFQQWGLSSETIDDELRRHHRHLQRIADVLRHVGARLDLIDFEEITEKQHMQLHDLHPALLDNIEVTPNNLDSPGRLVQPVGSWELELFLFPGDKEGSFRIQHLLDPRIERQFIVTTETPEGPRHAPATPYELIEPERYPATLNLGLNRIVEIYANVADARTTTDQANQTLLNLLDAADQSTKRKDEFLDAAQELNDWLADRYGADYIYVINKHQVRARRGETLTQVERSELLDIRDRARAGEVDFLPKLVELACLILLGKEEDASHLATTLTPGETEVIESWPIWRLRSTTVPSVVRQ